MNQGNLKIIFSVYFSAITLILIILVFLFVRANTNTFISLQTNNSTANTSSSDITKENLVNQISLNLKEWEISSLSQSSKINNNEQFKQAVISIDVDDGWLSTYNNGFPIFNKYGFKVTDYIITGDSNIKSVYINYDQVKELAKQGHSIQSHTVSHQFLTRIPETKAESELKDSTEKLQSILGTKIEVVATPYCDSNKFIRETAKKYYQLLRNCDQTVNNTKKNLDSYSLKAKIILNTTTLEQYKTWINEAIENKEWIILVYHRVGEGDNQYSVDTNILEEQMKFIKSKTDNKEVLVLPTITAYNSLVSR